MPNERCSACGERLRYALLSRGLCDACHGGAARTAAKVLRDGIVILRARCERLETLLREMVPRAWAEGLIDAQQMPRLEDCGDGNSAVAESRISMTALLGLKILGSSSRWVF